MNFTCPLCGNTCEDLLPIGWDTPAAKRRQIIGAGVRLGGCKSCGSSDRERLVYLCLKVHLQLFCGSKDKAVLHIAPERRLSEKIRSHGFQTYVCGDLFVDGYRYDESVVRMDLLALPFSACYFDFVICNHVLEHIPDDRGAMKELSRVLKPTGKGVVQVPLSANSEVTYEDPNICTPEAREEAFGQRDHCRIYGRDYVTRLAEAGFTVHRLNIAKDLMHYGVNPLEDVFVIERGSASHRENLRCNS